MIIKFICLLFFVAVAGMSNNVAGNYPLKNPSVHYGTRCVPHVTGSGCPAHRVKAEVHLQSTHSHKLHFAPINFSPINLNMYVSGLEPGPKQDLNRGTFQL